MPVKTTKMPTILFQVTTSLKRKKEINAVITGMRLVNVFALATPITRTPFMYKINAIEEQKTANNNNAIKFLISESANH